MLDFSVYYKVFQFQFYNLQFIFIFSTIDFCIAKKLTIVESF